MAEVQPSVVGSLRGDRVAVSVELRPRPPFRLDLTVWALRRRAGNRIDFWDGRYRRALVVDGRPFAIEVSQTGRATSPLLTLKVFGAGPELTDEAVGGARTVVEESLGLGVDLGGFYHLAERDKHIAGLAARFRGLKPPRFPTVFEALVNAVACQQLSLEVGIELLSRLSDAYGADLGGAGSTLRSFPEPAALAAASPEALRQLGFSNRKADTVVRLAAAAVDGDLSRMGLDALSRADAAAALQHLGGIGRWSAEYVMLRGLGRLEVYPGDDVGARNKLRAFLGLAEAPDYRAVSEVTAPWAPYAGMVYFHLLLDGLAERGLVG
ncbi:MAG: DNA-3-methyladenine glycosylase family protein [Acidimicrobiales bacterium]